MQHTASNIEYCHTHGPVEGNHRQVQACVKPQAGPGYPRFNVLKDRARKRIMSFMTQRDACRLSMCSKSISRALRSGIVTSPLDGGRFGTPLIIPQLHHQPDNEKCKATFDVHGPGNLKQHCVCFNVPSKRGVCEFRGSALSRDLLWVHANIYILYPPYIIPPPCT